MAVASMTFPSVFLHRGSPTLNLTLPLSAQPGRLTIWRHAIDYSRARLDSNTAMLFRALAREVVRCRMEAGQVVCGDQAEAALLEFLTDEDKRQLGVIP